jgi:hypothetical protein
MMKASRKRLIIAAVVLLAAAVVVTFAGDRVREAVSFVRLSPAEKKLVGEWKAIAMGGEVVTTIRADHTFTTVGGCLDGTSHGRWSLHGSDIVYSFGPPATDGATELEPARLPIRQLIDVDREARQWLAQYANK